MYDKLFVGGDLSGIQKFLYNITSKKAAASLKGRSYFLRKYMEDVCTNMKRLPVVAESHPEEIYCSGGKFYVIVQNAPGVQKVLEDYAKEIKSQIWKDHQGQLNINFSIVPFSENPDKTINANGKSGQNLGFLWRCVTEDFARQKNQKFLDQIKDHYEDFFEVNKVGGKPKVCAVTGVESEDCVLFEYDKNDSVWVLPSVKEQIEKGVELSRRDGSKTFEDYAKSSNGSSTYIGILRMDVDGLGKLFADKLKTFDEYKEFSARLDAYFTNRPEIGYVSNLQTIQQKALYKDFLTIIYAGGDDIFAVGRWDKIIDFAAEVRENFVEYINIDDTNGVSISGGVAIVHPKFPIAKAAEMAGEAEETAKNYKDGEKNAFCMFGEAISWKDEFDYVEQYKNEFFDLITTFDMPRGILHKIVSYAAIVERNKHQQKKDYSYIWHSAYYLTRLIERQKNNNQVVSFCKRLRDKELYGKDGNFRLMSIAARWAELTLRINQ